MAAEATFWGRRKAAVQAEAAAEAAAARVAAEASEAEALAAEQADKTEAEILADLGLPDPDTMAMGDDFSAFMGRAVPEYLRRRALRKLWLSNPVLANLDGLVDHGEDYTDAATVIPGMQTAYQVGKGMMSHVIALAEQAAAKAEADCGVANIDPVEPEVEVCASEEDAEETVHVATTDTRDATIDARDAPHEDIVDRPRRHMRFEFSS
jgi:hypothetical protein